VTEKREERDENQFSSPETKQKKKKRLATVLAISSTGERIYRRERKSRR
jgi:hypothetical protein